MIFGMLFGLACLTLLAISIGGTVRETYRLLLLNFSSDVHHEKLECRACGQDLTFKVSDQLGHGARVCVECNAEIEADLERLLPAWFTEPLPPVAPVDTQFRPEKPGYMEFRDNCPECNNRKKTCCCPRKMGPFYNSGMQLLRCDQCDQWCSYQSMILGTPNLCPGEGPVVCDTCRKENTVPAGIQDWVDGFISDPNNSGRDGIAYWRQRAMSRRF